jgi:hypothetical protein
MFEKRLNIVLDLDNTLVFGLEYTILKNNRNVFEVFDKSLKYADFIDPLTKISLYRIYARPYLKEFLDFLFKNFNVSVFTAADKDYAQFVINNFILTKERKDKGYKLDFIFYRYHFNLSVTMYNKAKNLEMLWNYYKFYCFFPCNTLIVDDLEDVIKSNPNNSIQAKYFSIYNRGNINFDALNDDDLLRVKYIIQLINYNYNYNECVKNFVLNKIENKLN